MYELKLYHGSTIEVAHPLTSLGRKDLDFGQGFYLTNDREQAESWAATKAARLRNRKPVVSIYRMRQDEFEQAGKFKKLVFPKYDQPWLDFVAQSRKGLKQWEEYDWIEGGIANDNVITTVDAYVDGLISAEQAIQRLMNERIHHQVCILNQEIIDKYLTFETSYAL